MADEDDRKKRRPRGPYEDDDLPGFGYRDPFFSSFDDEFESMRRYMDKMMRSAMKGGLEGDDLNKPFIYGFSMRTGPDGKPVFQEFGNTRRMRGLNGDARPAEQGPSRPPEPTVRGREPLTDVIDCGDTIAVTVELPGVDKADIELEVHEETLTIKVDTESRRYFKEVDLPSPVKEDTAQASYKNGVLDVTLTKKCPGKKKGQKVPIE